MFTKTKFFENFEITDKMVINIARVCCGVLVCALTINYFGYDRIGTLDEVSLQLAESQISTVVPIDDDTHNVYASGIKKEAYSDSKELMKAMGKNTFIVKEQLSDTGVPIELLEESEFTPDGSKMWVKSTKVNIREKPTVESEILESLVYSNSVKRESYGATWSKISLSDGTEGFILTSLLSSEEILPPTPTPTPSPTPLPKAPSNTSTQDTSTSSGPISESALSKTVYASCSMNLRSGPGTDCSLVRVLNTGDEITVVAQTSNGWYKTARGNYVKASLCTDTKPASSSSGGGGGGGGSNPLANYALQFVGCSYVYAGSSPSGFDCSGFVMYVYANYYGISLPHSADSISKYGTAISSSEMRPGDVVCNDHNGDGYMDHVSLYIGDGYIVHASTSTTGVIKSNFADVRDVATIRRIA